VGVRRLHRIDSDRVAREPAKLQQAACRARLAALAGFSLLAEILSVVMLRASFDVFAGHVVALCGIAALTMFATGAATPASRPPSAQRAPAL
jgi:hypothetical protein